VLYLEKLMLEMILQRLDEEGSSGKNEKPLWKAV